MNHIPQWSLNSAIWFSSLIAYSALHSPPTIAQLTPDASLGRESSQVTPDILINSDLADLIEGGALRDRNLFHSFLEFNVSDGQRVYFANPTTVETIVTRVTGLSESQIRGTLGVDGMADLYVINPNGIVFGPDAQLDIRGSFIGSTANGIAFEDGYTFSAANPDAPPLLQVGSPLGLSSWLPTTGAITNQGLLSVNRDLALTGNTIDLQGQLRAGGALTIVGTGTVLAQDTLLQPLILLAGEELLLQGNQGLEILALADPESGLFSSGNLVLRSNQAVIGDAHYVAGGSFQVERGDGSLGVLTSPNDPVIRASGDVSFDSYTGASLHILTGGGVTAGDITITGPDAAGSVIQEQVTLSDGVTEVAIDGRLQPTLDIRAGTLAVGSPGVSGDSTGFSPTVPEVGGTGTTATIAIGRITNPGGLVFLSNQYVPNPALSGDITVGEIITADFDGGGDIVIDAKDDLTSTFIDTSGGDVSGFLETFDPSLFNGNGGDLTLLAEGNLTLPEASEVYIYGLESGAARLESVTAIRQGEFGVFEGSSVGVATGGDVRFQAPFIAIDGSVAIFLDGEGAGGNLFLDADTFEAGTGAADSVANFATGVFGLGSSGNVLINAEQINLDNAFVGSQNRSLFEGTGGDVAINTRALTANNGAQVGSFTSSSSFGDAGNVTVIAEDVITLSGLLPGGEFFDFAVPSGIFSSIDFEAEGDGGSVNIITNTLSIQNGAQVRASSLGIGDGGSIDIQAQDAIIIDGAVYDAFEDTTFPSQIVSEVSLGGEGQGGDITLSTSRLTATNGGVISVSTDSFGNAGNIGITADEWVTFDGVTAFDIPSLPEETAIRESGLRSEALSLATGNGGNVEITTPLLAIINGATLEATTAGAGDAGSFKLNVSDTLTVDGDGSGIFANTVSGSTGLGGNIVVDPQLVTVQNGGRIAVDSQGLGAGGIVEIISEQLFLDRGLLTAETVNSAGGNITLTISDVIVLQDGSRISTTAGTAQAGGDGGNIAISTLYLVATPDENNDVTANAFLGAGGRVLVTAEGIFGLTPRSRAELEQLLGTTDPALLDPINLPSSDITAISQTNPELSGEVVVTSPGTDPTQGTIALPETIVDASRLIVQGCASGSIAAQEIGSLTVVGRGGLPTDPTEVLNSTPLRLDWATLDAEVVSEGTSASMPESPDPPIADPLQEVQSLALNDVGEVVLLAQGDGVSATDAWLPSLTCAGDVQED